MADDYGLTDDQLEFMVNIESDADQAEQDDNLMFFFLLVNSPVWKRLFGGMGWDQAYDRYEIAIGRCDDCGGAS